MEERIHFGSLESKEAKATLVEKTINESTGIDYDALEDKTQTEQAAQNKEYNQQLLKEFDQKVILN